MRGAVNVMRPHPTHELQLFHGTEGKRYKCSRCTATQSNRFWEAFTEECPNFDIPTPSDPITFPISQEAFEEFERQMEEVERKEDEAMGFKE